MKSRFIPCMVYKDAHQAIDWLCKAFGFEKKVLYENDEGKVAHAELTYQGNMIMLGSSDSGTEYSKLIKLPEEVGGFETQSPYIIIDDNDMDALYERAKKQGARMAIDLVEEDYGGRHFTCYDPEGHLWSFGSYDPFNKSITS